MTNKKSTKKALLMSCLSLLLCMSMLVGTTFAWFTDSVSSTNNIIKAGNLDVNLYWKTSPNAEWAPVDANTNIFKTGTLWEPGHTEVVYLKVVNEGTLALKYDLIVNIASETAGKNVAGENFNLSDYILYNVTDGVTTYANSAAARGDEAGKKLNTPYNKASQLLNQGEAVELTMVVFMPTTIGNEANYLIGTAAPVINLGINLFATQYTYEQDSFGPDYDADAKPVVVYTAEDLAAALTSDEEIISVILGNSIDLPRNLLIGGNAGDEYKMGGQSTEAIVIDLNGNQLNITTTYWSVLGTVNPETVVNIKNGSMNSSQTSGTWNSYDLDFASGNFIFENVVFEKAIALDTDATFKNVTINETHDYYAMWITTEGQTINIDGLTINSNGRGIKIDEQYISAPQKVTLNVANATFNTNKKAAIMVKSVAGADINLSNVNISNTPDATHAVWVDEDSAASYDLVTVTGGLKAYEGDMITSAAQLQAALDAATGDTVIYLGADITGDVTVTQKEGVNIVIEGNGNEYTGTIYIDGKNRYNGAETLTIQNINFVASTQMDFISSNVAKQYTHNVTIQNCSFTGNGAEVMGARFRQAYNITMKDCVADGMYGILWATGCNQITVDNVDATNGRNGISVGTSNATITNCDIDASAYGVRADGSAFTLTLENNNISAPQPVVVRKLTAAGYILNLSGNTFTATGADDYQVILTTGSDDAAYVAPAAANYTINGQSELVFFK